MNVFRCHYVLGLIAMLAGVDGAWAEATRPAVVVATWSDVLAAKDELTFIQRISGYALGCEERDFQARLQEKPVASSERASLIMEVLTDAWLAQEPGQAIAFWEKQGSGWPSTVQAKFFAKLAEINPKALRVKLAQSASSPAHDEYMAAAVQGLSVKTPDAALELALSADEKGRSFLVMLVVSSVAATDIPKALKYAEQISDLESRSQAIGHVLEVWFQKTPAEALNWANRAALSDELLSMLAQSFSHYAHDEEEKADRLLAGVTDARLRAALLAGLLSQAMPAQLWAHVKKGGWTGVSDESLQEMVAFAGEQKAEEATRLFKSIPVERLKNEDLIKKMTQAWAWLDADAAAAWASSLPVESERETAVLRMNTLWLLIAPEKAFAQIEATPSGPLRAQMVRNTALGMAKIDEGMAINWVNTQPDDPGKEAALESIVKLGADWNPEETAVLLGKLSAGPYRSKTYKEFASKWAENDPESALDWMLGLPEGNERKAVSREVLAGIAGKNPDYAAAMLGEIRDRDEQGALARALMRDYVGGHPDALPGLVAVLPEGKIRTRAVVEALTAIARSQPETALHYLDAMNLGDQRFAGINGIVTAWSATDPQAAAQWVAGVLYAPADKSAGKVAGALVKNWAGQDPQAVAGWVAQLPQGEIKNTATQALAAGLMERFPARAWAMLTALPDASKRGAQLTEVIRHWNESDPVAAERFIGESGLPADLKQRLLKLKK
ncbi:MAG: hypothetical protein JF599_12195 [Verrucomicrobia bacterium]|nr:hypothetical protein [Verrucomicrobiota bacterium]